MIKQFSAFLVAMTFCFMADAQLIQRPAPSPSAKVNQTIGLTDFTVEYSRPSVKGRKVFGGLVPFGEVWRTGANGSTDFTATNDFEFAGTKVKAGTYALYTVPNDNQWDVFLYENADHWGTPGEEFSEELVVAKSTIKPEKINNLVESLTIGFDHLRNGSGHLVISWENTMVQVPIEVYANKTVQENIDKVFNGPSANDYFSAASYYYEENLDMDKALTWVTKAVEQKPDAFWMSRLKAEILAKQGNYAQAIEIAKESSAAAEKAGNSQYVKFNQDNIARWMKLK